MIHHWEIRISCVGKKCKFAISDQGDKHYRAKLVDTGNSSEGHIYKVSLLDQALCYVKGPDVFCRGAKSDGVDRYGYLGNGVEEHGSLTSPFLSYDSTDVDKSDVSDISSTASHVCISNIDDDVWCWGWNFYDQSAPTLNDANSLIPRQVILGN